MRIGLIADLHGNLVALDAVLADLDRTGVDHIICLGDLAVLGPQPAEVIERVRERHMTTVCGNTDAWLIPDRPIPVVAPDARSSVDLTEWTRSQLSPDQMQYLRDLPLSISIPLDEQASLCCFHATPTSLDDITHAGAPMLVGEGQESWLMCCGHTHIQALWRVQLQRWINPGSVGLPAVGPGVPGLPRNLAVNWAEYAVLEIDTRRTTVTMHRTELDIGELWRSAEASDMPHQTWWRALWT